MIREVEEAFLESLRKGLSEFVPPENIIVGELDQNKTKSISLICTNFTVEEQGIGGSGGVKKEEIVEKFDSDGKKKDFNLTQKPLGQIIVESPIGTPKNEPDEFTIDYDKNIISFRAPPEKGKGVQVKYHIDRAVAETRNLKFMLTYSLAIRADDILERNKIILEVVKVLYRDRPELEKRGITDIRLIKGYSEKTSENQSKSVIEYQIETAIQIEMPLPPIGRIEIGKMKK